MPLGRSKISREPGIEWDTSVWSIVMSIHWAKSDMI